MRTVSFAPFSDTSPLAVTASNWPEAVPLRSTTKSVPELNVTSFVARAPTLLPAISNCESSIVKLPGTAVAVASTDAPSVPSLSPSTIRAPTKAGSSDAIVTASAPSPPRMVKELVGTGKICSSKCPPGLNRRMTPGLMRSLGSTSSRTAEVAPAGSSKTKSATAVSKTNGSNPNQLSVTVSVLSVGSKTVWPSVALVSDTVTISNVPPLTTAVSIPVPPPPSKVIVSLR